MSKTTELSWWALRTVGLAAFFVCVGFLAGYLMGEAVEAIGRVASWMWGAR